MMKRKITAYPKYLLLLALSFFVTGQAIANDQGIVPLSGKENGDYSLNDFVVVVINISQWILILSGSLALLAFIYGGFMFILSHGNKSWVDKGKESLIGATIGLVVVMLAWTAIAYFMDKIGYVKGPFGNWNSTN